MDCRTARDILDVLRPGTGDRAHPEVANAVAHLDDCDECTLAVRHREALDRQIGRAIRDVPVPAGLRERLQRVLRIDAPGPSGEPLAPAPAETRATHGPDTLVAPGAAGSPATPVRPRRRMVIAAGTAAALLLLALVWFLNRDRGPRVTLARFYENVPIDLGTAEPFDGSFEPRLPSGGWMGSQILVAPEAKGSDLGVGGTHVVALYEFRFRGRDGRVVEGILAVAEAGSIEIGGTAPRAFGGAGTEYPPLRAVDGRQFASRAWSSGEFVYVSLLPADRIDDLEQALDLPLG
jgi:hypothetical protein